MAYQFRERCTVTVLGKVNAIVVGKSKADDDNEDNINDNDEDDFHDSDVVTVVRMMTMMVII